MPEKDHKAGKLDKPEIIFSLVFVANHQAAKVVQPGEESFNFPAPFKAAQGASVLSDAVQASALAMGSNHLGPELLQHFIIQSVTVIGLIPNQSLGHIRNKSLLQC